MSPFCLSNLIQKSTENQDVADLITVLKHLADCDGNVAAEQLPDFRMKLLLGMQRFQAEIETVVSDDNAALVQLITGRLEKLFEASRKSGVYFLPKGELEHYYTQTEIDYLNFSDSVKNTAFHTERDFLLGSSKEELETLYPDLIGWLDQAIPSVSVDLKKHLRFQIIEWIQVVQLAVERGEIMTIDQLKTNGRVNHALFCQLFEVASFIPGDNKSFSCELQIAPTLLPDAEPITFTNTSIPAEIFLE